ncbi:MAG: hypothetical protein ACD_2C00091G0013 [uncultured bacterium (gcode 4)]|uniref:Uncharacterized protein n=1 Tax=uncultured bacterium (gcode 4) TaxID=1234023 RepID=K2G690_9BACT|nr:MAG: hypothetical protein ACD_2C00091G0013 [uncultured bacterium (gcode 4)]
MSNSLSWEIVAETKKCRHCSVSFDITDKDLEFYDRISPVFQNSHEGSWLKCPIPSPTLCPDCRQQRRLSFRNERHLYKRNCNATWKEIISMYSPDKPYKIYEQSEWWSDKWDPMSYWQDFDFSRWFFGQFEEMMLKIPRLWLLNSENENCNFNNYIRWCKNSYLSSVVYYGSEDIYYSSWIWSSKNIFDSYNINESENCYNWVFLDKCFNTMHLISSTNCRDCYFSKNLIGCSDCMLCTNLDNKKYHIENKEYTKEEYYKKLEEFKNGSFIKNQELKKLFDSILSASIVPDLNLVNCNNCFWDNLKNSVNAYYCFDVNWIENSKYLMSEHSKDCYDGIWWRNELSYEFMRAGTSNRVAFSYDIIESDNIFYSSELFYSSHLFGCIGLRNAKYCIFNKQYTKEEYEAQVPRIIEHMRKTWEWWEFFPSSISSFWYNETVANDYYPIPSHPAPLPGGLNIKWNDYKQPFPKVDKVIPASKLPDLITDVPDDILNWAIECEITAKPFRIIRQELDYYRKNSLPIPRRHPDERHHDRMQLRNPIKLYDRKCDKCWAKIMTTNSPDRTEKVYCKKCFDNEMR